MANKECRNTRRCACSHTECSRHGRCCECLAYHLQSRELPGCCFPPEVEKTDARSFEEFVEIHGGRK